MANITVNINVFIKKYLYIHFKQKGVVMDNNENEKVTNEYVNNCTEDRLAIQIENACGCKGHLEQNECGCGDICDCEEVIVEEKMTEEENTSETLACSCEEITENQDKEGEEIEGYASVEAVCDCNCLTNPLNVGERSCDCECPQNFNIFE